MISRLYQVAAPIFELKVMLLSGRADTILFKLKNVTIAEAFSGNKLILRNGPFVKSNGNHMFML